MSVRVEQELKDRIEKAAVEDYRQQVDEIRYLLHLGLNARDELKALERNRLQVAESTPDYDVGKPDVEESAQ